ncbi:39 kDa initiator binding protein, putative [Trichomonas vaginalis G3]|uniref:39 kDa initiator binding protein, putative n=1 Tax=Trichomonas vaginalis (strain ATCC PRA-98 / G3) TaxID=412133 RepID=A2E3Z9_TRIV3|nr:Initiator binding protein 39 kDa family [Trichomonas vaginalis G3]EAY12654.1 39 kDa initiator binding protein, putative [Trichomonas vaginalis G3]KAI5547017.1 Initiator binding protein 39 kDa family [Trichomonas vaginalis G3]|eukprot:XP_001324877.1 39 kDa initiator binding protein [Trichomonas vaginalis G3]
MSIETLPNYIQEILKARSTKSPNARFVRKLHVLLSYVDTKPDKENSVGLAWISDDEFKMHKKTLCQLLDVKINSLNVNLKKLQFTQTETDKAGWTTWTRKGFNRRDASIVPDETENENIARFQQQQEPIYSPSLTIVESIRKADSITIGALDQTNKNEILSNAINIWQQIVEVIGIDSVRSEFFILKLAKRYNLHGQSFENSLSVIKSILAPTNAPLITFLDFYKFYLAFGPEPTIMIKIHSLLEVAVNDKPWLYFGYLPDEIKKVSENFAYFDTENEPNCLVIVWNGMTHKGYNLPNVSSDSSYVVAEAGTFKSWTDYIQSLHII